MSLFHPLSLGWLHGWLPMAVFYGSFFILLKVFPKETVDRLYDDSGWTVNTARPAKIVLALLMVRIVLSQLRHPEEGQALENESGQACLDYKNTAPRYLFIC